MGTRLQTCRKKKFRIQLIPEENFIKVPWRHRRRCWGSSQVNGQNFRL